MKLDIRVQPRASRNSIEIDGERPDVKIIVRVTAAPEGGKANDAVVALLAKRLRVPKRSIQIVRGHKSRDKRISIEGKSAAEALKAIRPERGKLYIIETKQTPNGTEDLQ